MYFLRPDEFISTNERIYSDLKNKIREVMPFSVVEHIGSSAIKGAISKGDLDILVRVERPNFQHATDAIQALNFSIKEGTLRTESLCMFESKDYEVDVAIQLIEAGSEFEDFISFRDILNSENALVKQYNELKMACTGLSENQYRAHKSQFIEKVLSELKALKK